MRIMREYQRIVMFGMGKCIGARGPGPIWLIPFVDRPIVVDLRELFVEVPHQSCITKDNVQLQIDFLVYRQVVDAVASVVAVTNFASASQGIAATTLRAVIGDISLDGVLAPRRQSKQDLRRQRGRWGGGGDGPRGRHGRGWPAARGAGGDDPPDVGRTDAARGGDRVR